MPHHSLGMVLFSMLCNFNKHLSLWFLSFPHNYEDICCKITTWCYITISIIDTTINTGQDNAYHSVYYSINLFPNPPLLLTTTTAEFCIFLVETSLPLCRKKCYVLAFRHLKPFGTMMKTLSYELEKKKITELNWIKIVLQPCQQTNVWKKTHV